MKDEMIKILSDYVKTHHVIHVSSVVIELFVDELIKNGVVIPTHCADCSNRTSDGHCFVGVEGVGYKKTTARGYCDNANGG